MVQQYGMPLEEALCFGTSNTAHALELYPRKGHIQVGADADLLLMEENLGFKLRDCKRSSDDGGWQAAGQRDLRTGKYRTIKNRSRSCYIQLRLRLICALHTVSSKQLFGSVCGGIFPGMWCIGRECVRSRRG